MALVAYILTYFAIAVFLIAVIARFFMWAKMPIHVRWELYPVAHEAKRAHYGGSYLEEVDWWKKPRQASLWGELKVMIPEILFLVALKEHNPKLWIRSFPFHFGLYLIIGCTLLMMKAALLGIIWPTTMEGAFGNLLHWAIMICGYGGLLLSLFGALGLLQRRIADPDLKDFTAPADIFNLLFFVIAFGLALVHILVGDRDFSKSVFFVMNLLTFKMAAMPVTTNEALLTYVPVILMALLVAYIPLTHMSHFIGKYFAYHSIRWNDTPNLRGGNQEKAIQEVLNYPVTWAAPHIKGDGKKTWADVATEEQKK